MNCNCNCNCNPKKFEDEKIQSILDKYKNNPHGLIACLQDIQAELTYIPEELVCAITKSLNVPESDIFSVISFYNQFNLRPKAKYKIEVCLGTACFVLGIEKILDHLKEKLKIDLGEITEDNKFELAQSRCLGCCGMAPVISINEKIYGNLTTEDIDKILSECE